MCSKAYGGESLHWSGGYVPVIESLVVVGGEKKGGCGLGSGCVDVA